MEALRLYRAILRETRSLKYTDRDFLRREIRREFDKWKNERNRAEIDFQIEVL